MEASLYDNIMVEYLLTEGNSTKSISSIIRKGLVTIGIASALLGAPNLSAQTRSELQGYMNTQQGTEQVQQQRGKAVGNIQDLKVIYDAVGETGKATINKINGLNKKGKTAIAVQAQSKNEELARKSAEAQFKGYQSTTNSKKQIEGDSFKLYNQATGMYTIVMVGAFD